jgi:hypothetical protein
LDWFRLGWPRETTPEQVVGVFRLLASTGQVPIILEAVGSQRMVEHCLALPSEQARGLSQQLRSALPGLSTEPLDDRPTVEVTRAFALGITTRRRSVRSDDLMAASRTLLTALSVVGRGEQVVVQVVLSGTARASVVPRDLRQSRSESWLGALVTAPFIAPQPADAELLSAMRVKHDEPGWRGSIAVGVRGATVARERQVARQITGALRSAEAPGVQFWFRPTSPKRLAQADGSRWRMLRLNAVEVAALSCWPVGHPTALPVHASGSRLLAPSRAIPRRGRIVAQATFPGEERPLALSAEASLRHLHCLGPTGSGKSTLLLNLICQDMAAGRAVVVIEPKGDLIADVLARIPKSRLADVVLIDPVGGDRVVGLNPLDAKGRSPELVADQLLGMFHSLYAANWGPRTHDILGASLLTLARMPGSTLVALPLLLSDASYRRRVLAKVVDPIGLGPFWSAFEAWSEPERVAATAPVLNKLRPLIMKPAMRALLGQTCGSFDFSRVFTERKILLVNLSKGQLGPETAGLLGSLIVSQLWQAILSRSSVRPERRHPVFVYVDEFQDYLHLPLDFADALAQARGLGVGFTLAHQYLHQLDPPLRSAVLANAQSRAAFRLGGEDARALAADSNLDPEDFRELPAYHCYAQLVAESAPQPWASAETSPAPLARRDANEVRRASTATYGALRSVVEAELEALLVGNQARAHHDDLSPKRRMPGGEL